MIGEHLRLGFIPLADCAPLAVADALGLFRAEGLTVELAREASWATIRDKVQARLLDGAHMLGPMPLASSLGAGGERSALIVPMALNQNGSAITLSRELILEMREADPVAMMQAPCTARPLARAIDARRAEGRPQLVFSAVFPFSIHAYALRWWLAEAGVDPDRDVRLIITPPPRMTAQLGAGEIDGFCVGAPWNAAAEASGAGQIVIRGRQIWPSGPDKVLGVSRAFAEREPEALQALLRALIKAAAWADMRENRGALAELLARPDYVGEPAQLLRRALVDSPDAIVFHAAAANFPWRSQAAWFLAQMRRWGQIGPGVDAAMIAAQVYRPDLYRLAAEAVGVSAPLEDSKVEGAHAGPWSLAASLGPIAMPADRMFDEHPFDSVDIDAYLGGFRIRREPASAAP
jgi:ABC-type nitrate/sulfonate/bicarbonate transport system substrate-binding protein